MGCIGVCFVQISLVFVSNIGMGDVAVDRNIIIPYLIGVRCVFMWVVVMGLIPMGACNPSIRMEEVVVLMVDMRRVKVPRVSVWYVPVIRVIDMGTPWVVHMRYITMKRISVSLVTMGDIRMRYISMGYFITRRVTVRCVRMCRVLVCCIRMWCIEVADIGMWCVLVFGVLMGNIRMFSVQVFDVLVHGVHVGFVRMRFVRMGSIIVSAI
jgi:hypothetical protein